MILKKLILSTIRDTAGGNSCIRQSQSWPRRPVLAGRRGPLHPFESMSFNYNDVIMGTMASQITSLTIVYSTVYYSGTDQRKHQSSASLAFVWGIHRWPVNSPHKWPETRKIFPFDDVIMWYCNFRDLNPTVIITLPFRLISKLIEEDTIYL